MWVSIDIPDGQHQAVYSGTLTVAGLLICHEQFEFVFICYDTSKFVWLLPYLPC